MATLTLRKPGMPVNRWLIIGLAAIAIAIAAAIVIVNPFSSSAATRAVSTTTVARGTLTQTVSGSGTVAANRTLDLGFQTSGNVDQVLVKAGDTVQEGQVLATLDNRELEAAVESARANLTSAQASLSQKQNGNATAQEVVSAQAAMDSAQAAYDALIAGPTALELASAQASVTSAQAAYAAAQKEQAAGSSTLRSLKASLDQAEVVLQQAQSAYDKVAWRSDVGASSESADLRDATIAYEKTLADYNAQLTTSDTDNASTLASASANLKSAQQNLAALMPTKAEIASAKASLEAAKTTYAGLTAATTDSEIAIARASVTSAEQSLKQAALNLEQATLQAPFAGVVSAVNIVQGGTGGDSALTLIDQDPMRVDLTLSENNVVKAVPGQTAKLTSDAISGWSAEGTVSYIAPTGTESNGVVTYIVQVDFPNTDSQVRVGMTLNVDLVTANKENVLVVPNAAILPEGDGHVVQVVGNDGKTRNVQVETGITDGTRTEIISGLTEGQKIASLASATVTDSTTSTNGGGAGGFPGGAGGRPGGGLPGIP